VDHLSGMRSKCDDSFTELWETAKKENTTTLCRDAENLNWLCFSKLVADKRLVIKCTDAFGKKIGGYFVYDINKLNNNGTKMMVLRDAFVPVIQEDIIRSLVTYSIDIAKYRNVSALIFWSTNREMEKIIKKIVKIRRRCSYKYFYKFNKIQELDKNRAIHHEFIASLIDPDRGTL
jgi:hypothetical protein